MRNIGVYLLKRHYVCVCVYIYIYIYTHIYIYYIHIIDIHGALFFRKDKKCVCTRENNYILSPLQVKLYSCSVHQAE